MTTCRHVIGDHVVEKIGVEAGGGVHDATMLRFDLPMRNEQVQIEMDDEDLTLLAHLLQKAVANRRPHLDPDARLAPHLQNALTALQEATREAWAEAVPCFVVRDLLAPDLEADLDALVDLGLAEVVSTFPDGRGMKRWRAKGIADEKPRGSP